MGFFDLKATCGVCGQTVGLNRHKIIKSKSWCCPQCLKKAGGPFVVNIAKLTVEDIRTLIDEREKAKTLNNGGATASSADELKKFKELLEDGVITQEEFELKKKQLLGL